MGASRFGVVVFCIVVVFFGCQHQKNSDWPDRHVRSVANGGTVEVLDQRVITSGDTRVFVIQYVTDLEQLDLELLASEAQRLLTAFAAEEADIQGCSEVLFMAAQLDDSGKEMRSFLVKGYREPDGSWVARQ